jgi:hypothetical protein
VTRTALSWAAWLSAIALVIGYAPDEPNPYTTGDAAAATGSAHAELVQGKDVVWWSRRAVQARKDANARGLVLRRLRHARLVQFVPPYEHAAKLAAIAYGVDAGTLIRKGRCESARWTRFHNKSGASGPWQFLPSTWASTPYGAYSPYDPFAAALAAAWMHARGRGGEWVCQ